MIKRVTLLGILLTTILLISAISGCTDKLPNTQETHKKIDINFETVTHKRSDISQRTYKAFAVTCNGVYYEIEEACVKTQTEAKEYVESIDAEITRVMDFFEYLDIDLPNILVVTKNIMNGKNLIQSYHYDNTVITSIEHINSKEYLHALIGAVLDSNIHWINYGLAGQFNSNTVNKDEVITYLCLDNNKDVLDFFGARFYETIAGNDTDNTIMVTQAFVDYYITTYGKDVFLNYITSDDKSDLTREKNEWLGYLGLEQDYAVKNNIVFQNYEITENLMYDFEISSPYAIYRIRMYTSDEYFFSSIDRLVHLLTKNVLGIREVKAYFADAISDKSLIEFDTIPIYNIDEAASLQAHADDDTNIIMLHFPLFEFGHIHEYVHTISPINSTTPTDIEYIYIVEGIACYVTSSVNNEYSCNITNFNTYEQYNKRQVDIAEIVNNESDRYKSLDERGKYLATKFLEYYTIYATDLTEFSDFNMKLYTDAYSYALFELVEKYPSVDTGNYNDYSFYESFVGYLVDEYSLEMVLQAIKNFENIEVIFGKSFDELHSDWKDSLYQNLNS